MKQRRDARDAATIGPVFGGAPRRAAVPAALARAVGIALLLAACGGASPPPSGPEDGQPDPPYVVALRFEDAGEREDETPQTRVVLVRIAPSGDRTSRPLSVEAGSCYHERSPSALIGARCWWGAEGALFELRRNADGVTAWRAEVRDETQAGDARVVGQLDVPRGAELTVLSPDAM